MSNDSEAHEDKAKCEECLPRDQASRLFAHTMHEDLIFNSRSQTFVIVETLLLAALGLRQEKFVIATLPVRVFSIGALVLSMAWSYVQMRQQKKLKVLTNRLAKFLPEFARSCKWTKPRQCCPTAKQLIAYVVPSFFVALWSVILVTTFLR